MKTRTRKMIETLVRRNADACEHARKKRCHCPCNGALHRKPHPEEWVQKIVERQLGEAL
jgi:hypothetical protein